MVQFSGAGSFGITGASSSIVLVAFLAILGAVHSLGPFTGGMHVNDVLSLQLFLLVAGSSFMVLAAVVEEHKAAEQSVRESENRLRLAQQVARIGAFELDVLTGIVTATPQMETLYGLPPGGFGQTRTAFENLIHRDDIAEVGKLVNEALPTPVGGPGRDSPRYQ
jgi:PAS domain-containing protein